MKDSLLTKKVTAYYYIPANGQTPTDLGQPITYQDQKFYLARRSQDTYQYDNQKRLVLYQMRNPDRLNDSYSWHDVSYAYEGKQLTYHYLRISPIFAINYTLNERGHIMEKNTYDQDGYLVYRQEGPNATVTQTISGGNIIKKVSENANSRLTTTYEYDLSRPGLPNPEEALWGRSSRNLVVRTTERYESFMGVALIMPDYHVTTYTYEFDAKGVVKRQTAYVENSLTPNPAIVAREVQISVFEFR